MAISETMEKLVTFHVAVLPQANGKESLRSCHQPSSWTLPSKTILLYCLSLFFPLQEDLGPIPPSHFFQLANDSSLASTYPKAGLYVEYLVMILKIILIKCCVSCPYIEELTLPSQTPQLIGEVPAFPLFPILKLIESPSSNQERLIRLPFDSASNGFVPSLVNSNKQPSSAAVGPDNVPDAMRSPGRMGHPPAVWCASICEKEKSMFFALHWPR